MHYNVMFKNFFSKRCHGLCVPGFLPPSSHQPGPSCLRGPPPLPGIFSPQVQRPHPVPGGCPCSPPHPTSSNTHGRQMTGFVSCLPSHPPPRIVSPTQGRGVVCVAPSYIPSSRDRARYPARTYNVFGKRRRSGWVRRNRSEDPESPQKKQ